MPYIYKITNLINGKVYIGKTLDTIEKRWKDHKSDSVRPRCEKRPLYSAMNKYGVENFIIEEVEKCSEKELSEREKYWIEFYHSFHDGYNATTGGDGKQYADYDLIYKLFQEGKTCKEIKQITNYDGKTIQRALELNGVDEQTRKERGRDSFRKRVAKIDLNTNEILEVYTSIREAEKANGQTRHIGDVCNGKRKSCKGFGWKILEE